MRDVTVILANGNRARVQLSEESIARYAAAGLLASDEPSSTVAPDELIEDPVPAKTAARKGANKARSARKG